MWRALFPWHSFNEQRARKREHTNQIKIFDSVGQFIELAWRWTRDRHRHTQATYFIIYIFCLTPRPNPDVSLAACAHTCDILYFSLPSFLCSLLAACVNNIFLSPHIALPGLSRTVWQHNSVFRCQSRILAGPPGDRETATL